VIYGDLRFSGRPAEDHRFIPIESSYATSHFVNNTNLHHISRTVATLSRSIGQIVAFDRGCHYLMHSLSVISLRISP